MQPIHLDISLPFSNHVKYTTSSSRGWGYNPASWAVFDEKPIINRAKESHYWEKFALSPDLSPWASSSQQVYRQWTWPHSLISTLLFDGSFLPNGYLFSGTCLYETNFSDPLPPGVTRERISGIFTANRAWCTNERAFSYVSMCTPVIALESQLAGSYVCLLLRSVIMQV